MGLEELLRETIEALSRLDAGRVEALAELAERIGSEGTSMWPETAAEWKRAAASHWVLGHLVGATARQLAVQRRIANRVSESGSEFRGYRPDGNAELAARMNAVLAWPGRRGRLPEACRGT
jgi:hypothetical protein